MRPNNHYLQTDKGDDFNLRFVWSRVSNSRTGPRSNFIPRDALFPIHARQAEHPPLRHRRARPEWGAPGGGKKIDGRRVCGNDGTKEDKMMRVSFSTMTMARAAVNVLEAYGYS